MYIFYNCFSYPTIPQTSFYMNDYTSISFYLLCSSWSYDLQSTPYCWILRLVQISTFINNAENNIYVKNKYLDFLICSKKQK